MKKNMIAALSCLLLFASCDKSTDPVATVKNEIVVKVYNTSTWNVQTNKMDSVAGATVYLLTDSATLTATTDKNGLATFSNVTEKMYYISTSKEDLSNLLNKETVAGKVVGNLIIGVYKTQEDINSSARNPAAAIGGAKLSDVNGDGQINTDDKVQGLPVDFKQKYEDVNKDGVIDVKDIVNGNLIKLDQTVNVSVYIGK